MNGNHTTEFTDVEEFKQTVEDSDRDVVRLSDELKGTPMGCTIETLIECAKTYEDPRIIKSARTDVPVPVGASFKVDELHDAVDLIEKLGSYGIEDFQKHDDGSVEIGYHFD